MFRLVHNPPQHVGASGGHFLTLLLVFFIGRKKVHTVSPQNPQLAVDVFVFVQTPEQQVGAETRH